MPLRESSTFNNMMCKEVRLNGRTPVPRWCSHGAVVLRAARGKDNFSPGTCSQIEPAGFANGCWA